MCEALGLILADGCRTRMDGISSADLISGCATMFRRNLLLAREAQLHGLALLQYQQGDMTRLGFGLQLCTIILPHFKNKASARRSHCNITGHHTTIIFEN